MTTMAHEPPPATCTCGKRLFLTEHEAGQVLVGAKIRRDLRGDTRRQERRAYRCPTGSGWHLSSREAWSAAVPHYAVDDDTAAWGFIDRQLELPGDDAVWQALFAPERAAQTERVLGAMLHDLQAEMASRRAFVGPRRRGAERAEYEHWSAKAMARQGLLAARRKEALGAVRLANVARAAADDRQTTQLHRDVLRRLAVAVDQHRTATTDPTPADRQLWAWVDVLSVPYRGGSTSLRAMLDGGGWSP